MLGLSGEHLLILFLVLLFFGPNFLPQAGRSAGKALGQFRKSKKDLHDLVIEPEFKNLGSRK